MIHYKFKLFILLIAFFLANCSRQINEIGDDSIFYVYNNEPMIPDHLTKDPLLVQYGADDFVLSIAVPDGFLKYSISDFNGERKYIMDQANRTCEVESHSNPISDLNNKKVTYLNIITLDTVLHYIAGTFEAYFKQGIRETSIRKGRFEYYYSNTY